MRTSSIMELYGGEAKDDPVDEATKSVSGSGITGSTGAFRAAICVMVNTKGSLPKGTYQHNSREPRHEKSYPSFAARLSILLL